MSPDDQRPSRHLHVVVTDGLGRPLRRPALGRWLEGASPRSARGQVTIALVADGAMRSLNRRYAGADYVTDVLSFAAEDADPSPSHGPLRRNNRSASRTAAGSRPRLSRRQLGDIVIATGRARRQARDAGHSVDTELRILALHGLLHLLGYDHTKDSGTMARIERRLRRRGGLREGLIERARTEAGRRS